MFLFLSDTRDLKSFPVKWRAMIYLGRDQNLDSFAQWCTYSSCPTEPLETTTISLNYRLFDLFWGYLFFFRCSKYNSIYYLQFKSLNCSLNYKSSHVNGLENYCDCKHFLESLLFFFSSYIAFTAFLAIVSPFQTMLTKRTEWFRAESFQWTPLVLLYDAIDSKRNFLNRMFAEKASRNKQSLWLY